jgi:hypothetical protein
MPVNDAFIHLGCRAVFLRSIEAGRFVHIRDAVGDGLERLIQRDRIYVRASARRYRRGDYQGDHVMIITFTPRHRALLEDTRAELRALTDSKCTYFDAIVIALLESVEATEICEAAALPDIVEKKS